MNAQPVVSAAGEINRLHAEVQRHSADSKNALTEALIAAWQAGQLLAAERKRVNHTMGRGTWNEWLRVNFRGSLHTAQRYIRLATGVSDPSFLRGLSLGCAAAGFPHSRFETDRAIPPRAAFLTMARPMPVRVAFRCLVKDAENLVVFFGCDIRACRG